MTQEERQLLLKDLSARLPYGIKVHVKYNTMEPCYGKLIPKDIQWFIDSKIEEIKPYLRPMSSMTEEEKVQLSQYACIGEDMNGEFIDEVQRKDCAAYIDWLNAHHFDYRGLIEKGLALEAPKGMYGEA